jgi:hypothetical protein
MNISVTAAGIVVSSFTTRPVLSQGPDEVRLARRHPEETVFGLLNRAERAERAGHIQEAEALYAKAERMFRLVTS